MRLASAPSVPNAVAFPRVRRGLSCNGCNGYQFYRFRMFIANSLPSSPVLYKRTASCMSRACTRKLSKAPLQSPIADTHALSELPRPTPSEARHRWHCWKLILVSVMSLLVPAHRQPGLPFSVVVHGVDPTPCQGNGGRIGAWRDFDECVFDFREFLEVSSTCFSFCIWRGCVLAFRQAVIPFQPRFQHAQRVPLLEMLLSERSSRLWPSAPVVLPRLLSGGLTRVRSATDCSLDVPSWLVTADAVVVAASGASGRLNCTLGIGPNKMS